MVGFRVRCRFEGLGSRAERPSVRHWSSLEAVRGIA